MVTHDVSAGLQFKSAELGVRRRDVNHPAQSIQAVHRYILRPHVEPVTSRRYTVDGDITVRRGNPEVWGAQRNDDRTHLGMNIAEDVRNTIAIEPDRASGMGFVETEVKTLSVEERKNIVVERVEVGKVYAAAGPDNQNMRDKLLILLLECVLLRRARRRSTLRFVSWRKPDNHVTRKVLRGMAPATAFRYLDVS